MSRVCLAHAITIRLIALTSVAVFAACGGESAFSTRNGGQGGGGGGGGPGGTLGGGGTGGTVGSGGSSGPGGAAGTGGSGGTGGIEGTGGSAGSDGSGIGGTGGSGGASGTAGTGGIGGGGGAGGVAGTGGIGGAAGTGGATGTVVAPDGGAPTSAVGVVVLTVPLTMIGEGQRFNAQNRAGSSVYDLSGQTVTIRAHAPGAIGGDMSVFFRSPSVIDSAPTRVGLNLLTGGFFDVVIPVPEAAGGYDPTMVDVVRIEIEADSIFGETFQTPATIVYIDSITSSNGVVMLPFDTSPPSNSEFMSSGARPLTGSTFAWLAQYP